MILSLINTIHSLTSLSPLTFTFHASSPFVFVVLSRSLLHRPSNTHRIHPSDSSPLSSPDPTPPITAVVIAFRRLLSPTLVARAFCSPTRLQVAGQQGGFAGHRNVGEYAGESALGRRGELHCLHGPRSRLHEPTRPGRGFAGHAEEFLFFSCRAALFLFILSSLTFTVHVSSPFVFAALSRSLLHRPPNTHRIHPPDSSPLPSPDPTPPITVVVIAFRRLLSPTLATRAFCSPTCLQVAGQQGGFVGHRSVGEYAGESALGRRGELYCLHGPGSRLHEPTRPRRGFAGHVGEFLFSLCRAALFLFLPGSSLSLHAGELEKNNLI
ncbi:hypothetical protein Droror1_Dr00017116 [Drosera rotundifolia]